MQEPRNEWLKRKQSLNWKFCRALFAASITVLTSAATTFFSQIWSQPPSTAAAVLLAAALPSACFADPTQTDAHDDFWQFMKEVDRLHELKIRDERREDELARQMEERLERRAMAAKRQPLYGDVKSRRLNYGAGDDNAGNFGGNKIVGADDIFGKDKTSGNDFMTSRLSESDAQDDSVRPGPLGALKKKISHADDADDTAADPRMDEWKHLLGIDYDIGDWAPSPLDLKDNGGFTHQKDNGRPVPYRLNGHVNENRGFPWATND